MAGLPSAVRVGSTLSYLVSDGLNSVSEAFDTNGNEIAAQLYTPYGQTRYSSDVLPTAKGFTGQRGWLAATTRYFAPYMCSFVAADAVVWAVGQVCGSEEAGGVMSTCRASLNRLK